MNFFKEFPKKTILAFALAGLFGAITGSFVLGFVFPGLGVSFTDMEQLGSEERAPVSDNRGEAVTVAEQVLPTVVGVATTRLAEDDLFQIYLAQGVGSGVIVQENGYILTNDHVVRNARNISVTLADGKRINARLLWSDPGLDLAIIKVNSKGLPSSSLGDSAQLRIGEPVIAVGNPLGLNFQRTVTAGIISALDRVISVPEKEGHERIMENLIQTDASINPGNSGGPLINSKGEVIGINTVKVTSAEGIGFSIPINIAKPIVQKVIKYGKYVRPGIGIIAFDRDVAMFYNQKLDIKQGVLIVKVVDKSPAEKAGLKPNDIILKINDKAINSMLDLRETLYSMSPGNRVKITYWRDGTTKTTTTVLEKV